MGRGFVRLSAGSLTLPQRCARSSRTSGTQDLYFPLSLAALKWIALTSFIRPPVHVFPSWSYSQNYCWNYRQVPRTSYLFCESWSSIRISLEETMISYSITHIFFSFLYFRFIYITFVFSLFYLFATGHRSHINHSFFQSSLHLFLLYLIPLLFIFLFFHTFAIYF